MSQILGKGTLSDHELWLQDASAQLELALEKIDRLENELHFLESYVAWKGLDAEYARFKEEAHEECEDGLPFSKLVM